MGNIEHRTQNVEGADVLATLAALRAKVMGGMASYPR